MKEIATEGIICLTDPETSIEYYVADIEYTEREDETFAYSFRPNYSVIDLLAPPLFQGIPGLNLDLRRDVYVRTNRTPVFISERTPSPNREDLYELLDEVGMDYLNRLEWLIRTDTRYGGDNFYVIRKPVDPIGVFTADAASLSKLPSQATKQILEAIAKGATVEGDGFTITDDNREPFHALLRMLYVKDLAQQEKERRAREKAEGVVKPRGRRRKQTDEIRYVYAVERFEEGKITAKEAAEEADMSRATFFRRLKELRDETGGADLEPPERRPGRSIDTSEWG